MKKIMLACDGSDSAMRALEFAITQSSEHQTTELHLINVQSLPMSYYDALTALSAKELQVALNTLGEETLAPALERLKQTNLSTYHHVHIGDVAQVISEQAEKLGCEQIIMGSRGLGALKGLMIGSVATRVVHLSSFPVTLIK
tara:strand:+ start:3526 stop:3954 length:429 start_codon:yes stop_codon:yes gene_type:complete